MYPGNVSLAQRYLENKVSSGLVSNYSLCLVAYALALANSPVAGTALFELTRRADYTGKLVEGHMYCHALASKIVFLVLYSISTMIHK